MSWRNPWSGKNQTGGQMFDRKETNSNKRAARNTSLVWGKWLWSYRIMRNKSNRKRRRTGWEESPKPNCQRN